MISRHKENKTKKLFNYFPLSIATLILIIMVGLIVYLLLSGGIFDYNGEKKLKELAGDEKSTSAIVTDMKGDNSISCKNKKQMQKEIENMIIEHKQETQDFGTKIDFEGDEVQDIRYFQKVYLKGLSEHFYAVVTNDFNKDSLTLYSTNNEIVITSPTLDYTVTLYVKLYAKDEDCKDELVKSFSIEAPMRNPFYYLEFCIPYRDVLKYCKEYTWEQYDTGMIQNKIEEYEAIKNNKKDTKTTTTELTKEQKEEKKKHDIKTLLIVVLAFGIIIVFGAVCVIKRKEE